jgi:ArsR family metal-binding transcriptional regulator
MDLYPLTDESKEKLEELRALIAEAVAKNDDDAKLLTAEENVVQLQEDDLLRYIKARKCVVADAYQQLIETLRWRATAYGSG